MHVHPQRKPLLAAMPRGVGLLPRDKVVLRVQVSAVAFQGLPRRGPRAGLALVVASAVLELPRSGWRGEVAWHGEGASVVDGFPSARVEVMGVLVAAPLVVLLVAAPVVHGRPWAFGWLVVTVAQVLELRQLESRLA